MPRIRLKFDLKLAVKCLVIMSLLCLMTYSLRSKISRNELELNNSGVGLRLMSQHSQKKRTLASFGLFGGINPNDYLGNFLNSLTKSELVNPHNFTKLIEPQNENFCSRDVFLLIYIHSAVNNTNRRTLIRNTWGHPGLLASLRATILFVMGKPNTQKGKFKKDILLESNTFGDMLQEDFIDSYRNLTRKGIAGLKFVSEKCQHVPFILKSDDDAFVNIFSLVRNLKGVLTSNTLSDIPAPYNRSKGFEDQSPFRNPRDFFRCMVWSDMPVKRGDIGKQSKWKLSADEWKADVFPNYCAGCAYMMSADVASSLYQASLSTPYFWIDDVYITGLLPIRLGVKAEQYFSWYKLNCKEMAKEYLLEGNSPEKYIFSHCPKGFAPIWEAAVSRESLREDSLLPANRAQSGIKLKRLHWEKQPPKQRGFN